VINYDLVFLVIGMTLFIYASTCALMPLCLHPDWGQRPVYLQAPIPVLAIVFLLLPFAFPLVLIGYGYGVATRLSKEPLP
jgi:hypothetical protein